MGFLNCHYQVAHRKNKASGCHDAFANFVGSHPYLLYCHLWLNQVPCLQNLAVQPLPANMTRDSQGSWFFPLASDTSTTEMTGCTNKALVLSPLVAEMGKGNADRI